MGHFFHEIWRTHMALFAIFLRFDPQPKTSIWLKKGGSSARTRILKTSIPALPGRARSCPALRCRKARIQAFSSRAGLQDDARWQSTTPSNQNRILLKRRPHQNLIDNEIWTQWATFSTKSGVPIWLFSRFFCDLIPNQKHRFGSKKEGPPRGLAY